MIVKQDFLNKLKDLGLNSYESKLWTSLLSRGISSAGELSDIANVPRSRTYDVLESLEKKGFIIMKIGKPIKYIAVPPEEVIDRVKKNVREEAAVHTGILDEFKNSDLLQELNILHNQGIDLIEPTDMSGAIKGRKNLYNQMEFMINEAKNSIVFMTTHKGLLRKSDMLLKPMRKAKDRGVSIKIISNVPKNNVSDFKELSSVADIKHTTVLNGRFMIADKTHLVFALLDGEETHPTYDHGIWINTPFFSESVGTLFDHIWDNLK